MNSVAATEIPNAVSYRVRVFHDSSPAYRSPCGFIKAGKRIMRAAADIVISGSACDLLAVAEEAFELTNNGSPRCPEYWLQSIVDHDGHAVCLSAHDPRTDLLPELGISRRSTSVGDLIAIQDPAGILSVLRVDPVSFSRVSLDELDQGSPHTAFVLAYSPKPVVPPPNARSYADEADHAAEATCDVPTYVFAVA